MHNSGLPVAFHIALAQGVAVALPQSKQNAHACAIGTRRHALVVANPAFVQVHRTCWARTALLLCSRRMLHARWPAGSAGRRPVARIQRNHRATAQPSGHATYSYGTHGAKAFSNNACQAHDELLQICNMNVACAHCCTLCSRHAFTQTMRPLPRQIVTLCAGFLRHMPNSGSFSAACVHCAHGAPRFCNSVT